MLEEDILDKTEPATRRKLQEIRAKGVVVRSLDLTAALVFFAAVVLLFFFGEELYKNLEKMTLRVWGHITEVGGGQRNLVGELRREFVWMSIVLAFPLLGIMLVALGANFIQIGYLFSLYPLKPRWSNLNIFYLVNYRKYFTMQSLMKVFLGVLKLFAVAYVTWKVILTDLRSFVLLPSSDVKSIGSFLFWKVCLLGLVLSMVYFIIGLFDLAYLKWRFLQESRMTLREVREEIKEMEGNIQWRPKIYGLMHQWAERRVIVSVPKANVIIMGSRKYAVALQYDPNYMFAPICISLGSQQKAEMIRSVALRFSVPLIINDPLAQSLFRGCKEGFSIPAHLYQAVAAIFVSLSQTKKKR